MSLAGIPPFSGFVAKLSLLQITMDAGEWPVVVVSLIVSVLTLVSMARLWQYGFWGKTQETADAPDLLAKPRNQWLILGPIALLVGLSLSIGIFGERFFQLSTTAAQQALDRQGYIAAVQPVDPASASAPLAKTGHD